MKSKRRNLEIRKTAQQGMQNVLVAKGTGGWVRMRAWGAGEDRARKSVGRGLFQQEF